MTIHQLYYDYSPAVLWLFTNCTMIIHQLYYDYSPAVLMIIPKLY